MRHLRLSNILLGVGLLWVLACLPARAQDDPAFTTASQPFSSYHGGDIDHVDLSTGNLSIDIPLMSYPQKGGKLGLNFALHYQSGPATGYEYCDSGGQCWGQFSAFNHGWVAGQAGAPVVQSFPAFMQEEQSPYCWITQDQYGNDYAAYCFQENWVQTLDQSMHQLLPTTTSNVSSPGWRSADGSGYVTTSNGVLDSAGTRYSGAATLSMLQYLGSPDPMSSYPSENQTPTQITDSNGNQITAQANANIITSWTDTMLRSIPAPVQDTPSASDPYPCPTLTGQTAVKYSFLWNFPAVAGVNNGTYPVKLCITDLSVVNTNYQPPSDMEIQSIVLPNGTAWTFDYDMSSPNFTGNLTRVNLPTGGSISYGWTSGPRICTFQYGCDGSIVASRTLDPQNGTPTSPWQYGYSQQGSGNSAVLLTTVTDPTGNDAVHTFTNLDTNHNSSYYESNVVQYQGTGGSRTPLKSVITTYQWITPFDAAWTNQWRSAVPRLYGYALNVFPKVVTTQLSDTGQISWTNYTYDSAVTFFQPVYGSDSGNGNLYAGNSSWTGSLGKPTSVQQTNYDGTVLGTTSTTYQFQANSNYFVVNLLNLPSSVSVSGAGPGSQTQYAYDENNGSPQCVCGNATSAKHWLNTTGGYLTTTAVYDSAGRVTTTYDAKNNQTIYAYGGGYAGSGPTSVTDALGHVTTSTYDLNTGLPTSVRDPNAQPNGQPTATQHDGMLRTKEIDYPDGGQTTYCYGDEPSLPCSQSGPPYKVVVTDKITSGVSKTETAVLDGLGRVTQKQLNSAPTCPVYVDYAYDPMGRQFSVSNPYCSTSDPTYGVTKTYYDALGRTTLVVPPDGAAPTSSNPCPNDICTSYYGNATTVTDQAGHQRKSFADAVGRLIEVDEPGGAGGSFTAGSGSGTVGGNEQSVGGHAATSGTGSASTSGSEQSRAGSPASSGTGSVTIDGFEQSELYDPCAYLYDEDISEYEICTNSDPPYWVSDSGTVGLTVNGTTCWANYGPTDTSSSIAINLAAATNSCNSYVSAYSSNGIVYITARAAGASTNYSLSAVDYYNTYFFSSDSFVAYTSGSNLAGGADSTPTTYDAGSAWVTLNGQQCSASYGSSDNSSTVASNLASAVNSCSSYVNASVSGTTVTLTAKTTGASTNYSLSSGSSSSQGFSPSFSVGVSGGALTGGSNYVAPTAYDAGTAWITVNGFQASVSYGQSSTASTVASAIANIFNTNSSSPVTASLSGSAMTLTAKTQGPDTNYSLSQGSATNQQGTFSSPSFTISVSGSSLTGGQNSGQYALGSPFVTTYSYDALDDLVGVVQGGSHNRSFVYDSLKRMTSSTNPEAGAVSYTYDADGNVVTKTDARNITITYSYNTVNQMTGRSFSNSDPPVTYTYGGTSCLGGQSPCYNVGRRTGMTDAGGSENFAYDAMGREQTEQRVTNGVTKSTAYTYNLDGSLATLTYPSGRMITYTPDSAGRPSLAKDVANGITYISGGCANGNGGSGVCYGPQGAVASLTEGSNLNSAFYYNTRLQPCRIAVAAGASTPNSCGDGTVGNVLDLSYSFALGSADNGNVAGSANNRDATRSQTFDYDTLNRLVGARTGSFTGANCWGEQYGYDAYANLTSIGALSGYTGCTQDNLSVSADGNNRLSAMSYDLSGNVTADGANNYAWNAESEMKTGGTVNYTYDGDGNRLQKSNGKIYWYGAGTEILDESDASGNLSNEYVFFGGKRIAMRVVSSGTIYYYAEDFLGSSRAMVQAGQTSPCFDADFLPFGREKDVVTTCTQNSYKFEGKERDSETGNDDFGARYYSSNFGRWLSPDWSSVPAPVPYANLANPQTLNLYAMVEDNPETFADLDGHVNTPAGISQFGTCDVTTGNGCDDNEQSILFGLPPNFPRSPQIIADYVNWLSNVGEPYALTYTPKDKTTEALKALGSALASELDKASDFLNDHPLLALAPELYRFIASEGGDAQAEQALEDEGSAIESKLENAFSISDWKGYPEGVPKPQGPFRLLEGEEYEQARKAANAANRGLRQANPDAYAGQQIHEIQPVKFGGSPTDPANKVGLATEVHYQVSAWWNNLMRTLNGR